MPTDDQRDSLSTLMFDFLTFWHSVDEDNWWDELDHVGQEDVQCLMFREHHSPTLLLATVSTM